MLSDGPFVDAIRAASEPYPTRQFSEYLRDVIVTAALLLGLRRIIGLHHPQ